MMTEDISKENKQTVEDAIKDLEKSASATEEGVDVANDIESDANNSQTFDLNELLLENEKLRLENEAMAKKAGEFREKALLSIAEAENAKKRAEADVERERKYALEKFVKSLIPIYDSLEKALEVQLDGSSSSASIIEGVDATLKLFVNELKTFGVEIVDPTGQLFDANYHQALAMVPSDNVPNNHVLQTMQKGFVLNGRVVRAANVIVAKAKEAPKAPENNETSKIDTQV